MFALTAATRVFVAVVPVDLRRSFNGLSALVQGVLGQDPLSGHLFLFTNQRRNRLKLLFWDGSGLWCCAKRLERGRLSWPQGPEGNVTLRPEEFTALVNGLEIQRRKDWYRK